VNILLINNYFPPEIGAASHLYFYLAEEFVKRGHKVTVLTGIPRYNVEFSVYKSYLEGKKAYIESVADNFTVVRVKLPYVDREQIIRRGIEHFEIAYKLFQWGKAFLKDIDISLVYSPPLTLFWTAEKVRKITGAPYILNVQDLFPQAAIDLGIMKNKIVISFFKYLEKKAYKSADLIMVHSESNKKIVDEITKDTSKTIVVENWVDDKAILPGDKKNEFSQKYNLTNKFVVSFAGTLGFSQDVEVIIKAAQILRNIEEIVFVIVGDGPRKMEAEQLVKKYDLKNVLLLPPVPKEEYPSVLHSSSISLATLTEDVKTPVVPSKILSIMSAGIPVIATMNLDGDAPRLIERAKCGFVLPAGDYKGLAEKIMELYKNPEICDKMGKNGRRYIEEHLSVRKTAERLEKVFNTLMKSKSRRVKR